MVFQKNESFTHKERYSLLWRLHIDLPLFTGIVMLIAIGLVVLYSAGGEDISLIKRQAIRLCLACVVMISVAQIPPRLLAKWGPLLYFIGLGLLTAVLLAGDVGKGAQRWLNLGLFKFQPSELMKLAVPMMVAWYFNERRLPPNFKYIVVALLLTFVPTIMIAKQPDLGTSLLIASSGLFILFFAGLSWRFIIGFTAIVSAFAPILWLFFMHPYQKQRVLTLLNPESDPLGSGYHIIQSKIAIGSGGLFGKGWLQGTQSQLDFLPETSTDFIFAVLSEEFGLAGIVVLLLVYIGIIGRGLYIGSQAQDTFTRLLSGSISLTFFVYVFVNIGMVSGILPVVGLPLPLVSYGGTSLVTMMASLGILMGIHTHRKLVSK